MTVGAANRPKPARTTVFPWNLSGDSGARASVLHRPQHAELQLRSAGPAESGEGSVLGAASWPEEYAIVRRIFDAPTEKTVVSIAGMTFNGTTAAGEFLTNEKYMREALGNAPAKWYQ